MHKNGTRANKFIPADSSWNTRTKPTTYCFYSIISRPLLVTIPTPRNIGFPYIIRQRYSSTRYVSIPESHLNSTNTSRRTQYNTSVCYEWPAWPQDEYQQSSCGVKRAKRYSKVYTRFTCAPSLMASTSTYRLKYGYPGTRTCSWYSAVKK